MTSGEEDPLLRQQLQLANQVSLLQQLTNQTTAQNTAAGGDAKASVSSGGVSSAANTVTSTAAQVWFNVPYVVLSQLFPPLHCRGHPQPRHS